MLRLSVETEDYLMIGEDIKIVFLGGSRTHHRVMLDVPKELNVVRGKVIKNNTTESEEKLPQYYAVPDLSEKYGRKKAGKRTAAVNDPAKKEGQHKPENKNN